ncbi:MAG: S-methyl-5-thioribose-1-phosphate isomerase [Planctomycetia bacterium]|nr:S-methyl-5-thioribose-1-phosphate isomerase [Planctomycetia bacterium]
MTIPRTLEWIGELPGVLRLLDQTRLPTEVCYLACATVDELVVAIRALAVRGAPAIGCAAAYGVCLGLQAELHRDEAAFVAALETSIQQLAGSRPTAVNLFWALERMRRTAEAQTGRLSPREVLERLLQEARAIEAEDRAMCRAIGRHGAALLQDGDGVLTHCNAGGLATSDFGTALAVIFQAHEDGKQLHVWVDETRPLLQGARLTAWELMAREVPCTLICDNMAAQVMRSGRVQAVVVGADRIAGNGDVANKIGTYGVAVLAAAHGVPFYVAAPSSTFDLSLASGDGIPIEQRAAEEITHGFGRQTAPSGVKVYNPAFDVTPASLLRGIVYECGVITPVNMATVAAALRESSCEQQSVVSH